MVKFIRQVHHAVFVKYDFGIRVDMGKEIGSGHFYRCLSLANELIDKGKEVAFIVKNEDDFLSHVGKKIIPFFSIDKKNEIKSCKLLLSSVKNLIIDLPSSNELYGKSFQGLCKTAIIDDLGGIKVYSDYLFNGSIVEDYHKYRIYNKKASIYLGPKYMILRKDFLKIRKKYSVAKKVKKILLTFGGSDELNLSGKFTKFFARTDNTITIVLGPSYKKKNSLLSFSDKLTNVKIETSVHDMASLFIKHDIAISSSGITSYELACLGIPSILIPIDSQQLPTSINMEKNGCAINYGYWDNNFKRIETIIDKLSEYNLRKEMYQNGRMIVDGEGHLRVAKHLLHLRQT